jgi:serine palmitoyltransferase
VVGQADTLCGQTLANGVLITRLKAMPQPLGVSPKEYGWQAQPALKVCVTTGLTRKEIEKAGIIIRHAITKIVTKKK